MTRALRIVALAIALALVHAGVQVVPQERKCQPDDEGKSESYGWIHELVSQSWRDWHRPGLVELTYGWPNIGELWIV